MFYPLEDNSNKDDEDVESGDNDDGDIPSEVTEERLQRVITLFKDKRKVKNSTDLAKLTMLQNSMTIMIVYDFNNLCLRILFLNINCLDYTITLPASSKNISAYTENLGDAVCKIAYTARVIC